MQEDVLPYTLVATLTMDVSPCLLISLEAQPPTPAIVDTVCLDHPLVPASLMEAGLDQNQIVVSS